MRGMLAAKMGKYCGRKGKRVVDMVKPGLLLYFCFFFWQFHVVLCASSESLTCRDTLTDQSTARCDASCSQSKLADGIFEDSFCSPKDCYCLINSAGLSENIVLLNNSERCFAFVVEDKHHYLQASVFSTASSIEGWITPGIGPEESPRLRLLNGNESSFHSYHVSGENPFILSRSKWRSQAEADEGEWEGFWSICLVRNQKSRTSSEEIVNTTVTSVSVRINASKCPLTSAQGRVCNNHGKCKRREYGCNDKAVPHCYQYYCE